MSGAVVFTDGDSQAVSLSGREKLWQPPKPHNLTLLTIAVCGFGTTLQILHTEYT